MNDTTWMNEAICSGTDPDAWTADLTPSGIEVLKRICHQCPVQSDCLQHALRHNYQGVWGGTTTREREQHKRRLRERRNGAKAGA